MCAHKKEIIYVRAGDFCLPLHLKKSIRGLRRAKVQGGQPNIPLRRAKVQGGSNKYSLKAGQGSRGSTKYSLNGPRFRVPHILFLSFTRTFNIFIRVHLSYFGARIYIIFIRARKFTISTRVHLSYFDARTYIIFLHARPSYFGARTYTILIHAPPSYFCARTYPTILRARIRHIYTCALIIFL